MGRVSRKGSENMQVFTLIILYALAGTIEVPTGCFVAAWLSFALQAVATTFNYFNNKERK